MKSWVKKKRSTRAFELDVLLLIYHRAECTDTIQSSICVSDFHLDESWHMLYFAKLVTGLENAVTA